MLVELLTNYLLVHPVIESNSRNHPDHDYADGSESDDIEIHQLQIVALSLSVSRFC